MNQRKAKAIRREMQALHGGTKAKSYTTFQRYFIKTVKKIGQIINKEKGECLEPGEQYRVRVEWIIADEPRQKYQAEKKKYNKMPRKQRAGRYPERNDL